MPDEDFIPETPKESARKGIEYYQMLQCDDGHWSGDYGEKEISQNNICSIFKISNNLF